MTDWDLLTPGIGLTSIGIVGVGISLSGIAKTFLDGMHAVTLLTMFIGMIFLASGLFKDGFPTSGRAKSATFLTLGFLVTFGVAAAVTVSAQVPSIYAYIGLMAMIAVPASVLTVASYRESPYVKALAVIFISAAIVGGITFYAFGLVTPKPPQAPVASKSAGNATSVSAKPPSQVIEILPGASAQNNPAFKPAHFAIAKGDAALWTNKDNTPHTITSAVDNGQTFNSGIIPQGKNYTLDTAKLAPGDYGYFCSLHPYMKGNFTVTAAKASSGSSNATSAAPSSNSSSSASSAGQNSSATGSPSSTSGQGGGTVTN
ncbi:MAG TPA: cupredoxin domain-containing protein, partial [Nitrososphaera sp.]|nr:cupredoxin domain-containing protein [Nitrososphaera sp.]